MVTEQEDIADIEKQFKCAISGIACLCLERCPALYRNDLLIKRNAEA